VADRSTDGIAETHLDVCRVFGDEVQRVGQKWHARSPCEAWDARGVLEHVIGFHDVLLLRPLDARPVRPKDDPVARWNVTVEALDRLFRRPGLFDGIIDIPHVGNRRSAQIDAAQLIPLLSLDVLVHSWDLALAAGHEIALDPELCTSFLNGLPADEQALASTGMYDHPYEVTADADPQTKLLARLGRDPDWRT
jgi:uncharacterized protein (TIGR03086 family)